MKNAKFCAKACDCRQSTKIGRPRELTGKGSIAVLERLNGEAISRRQAARELEIGYATLKRLLDSGFMAVVRSKIVRPIT